MRVITRQINIATWNVRTLTQVGKLHPLINELSRMNCKITGIFETSWNGNEHFQSRKGFNIYYSRSDTGKIGRIAIVVDPIANKALL